MAKRSNERDREELDLDSVLREAGGSQDETEAGTDNAGDLFESVFEQVEAEVAHETGFLANVRAWPTSTRIAAGILMMLLAALALRFAAPAANLGSYPLDRLIFSLIGFGGIVGIGLHASLRPIYRPALPGWATATLLASAALIPIVFAFLPEIPNEHMAANGILAGFHCFGLGGGLALGLFIAWRLLDRLSPGHPDRSLLAAASAGAAANFVLEGHCGIHSQTHLFFAHGGIALTFIVLGLFWSFAKSQPLSD